MPAGFCACFGLVFPSFLLFASVANVPAEVWTCLARLLGEHDLSVERCLVRLAEVWQSILPGAEICVVACGPGQSGGRFLQASADSAFDVGDVQTFQTHKAEEEWDETLIPLLPSAYGQCDELRFRSHDGETVGGLLVVSDTGLRDNDQVETLRLISARVLQEVGCSQKHAGEQPRTDGTIRADDDRLESLAEFAAGAGHEINNPLGTIIGRVQLLLRDEDDVDRRQSLSTIGGQAWRIRDMIGDAMLFARPPQPVPELLSLAELVDEVLSGYEDDLAASAFDVDVEFPQSLQLYADPVQARVMLGALVRNAIEAVRETGSHEMVIRAHGSAGGETTLEVSDTGVGLNDEQRRHLFDPFYSGRQAGRGLGFGLSKCWRIVSNHGGSVDVHEHDGWTTFRVTLPGPPGNSD